MLNHIYTWLKTSAFDQLDGSSRAKTNMNEFSCISPTLYNLQNFCKNQNIQGYSELSKFEILKLLIERNDLKSRLIVSHYLCTFSIKEHVDFYIFLNGGSSSVVVANRFLSYGESAWTVISDYRNLTDEFIFVFSPFLNWDILVQNPCLSDHMIISFAGRINFQQLSKRPNLSLDLIRMYKEKLNWFTLSYTQSFSELFLREMVTKLKITNTQVGWCHIGKYQHFSNSFLKDHMGFIYENSSPTFLWANLAEFQILSEDFILEHIMELPWDTLCTFQKLSLRVISELVEIVRKYYKNDEHFWCLISMHQNLPTHFLRQHKDKINWRLMVSCKLLPEDVILEFKNEIGRITILQYQNHLSRDFIEEHLAPYTKAESRISCSVCLEEVSDGVKTSPCLHDFCKVCIDRCLEIKSTCPYCRGNL